MTSDDRTNDLPSHILKPAQRALASAGIESLDDLAKHTESEVMALHGMGPKAKGELKRALAETGRSFAKSTSG